MSFVRTITYGWLTVRDVSSPLWYCSVSGVGFSPKCRRYLCQYPHLLLSCHSKHPTIPVYFITPLWRPLVEVVGLLSDYSTGNENGTSRHLKIIHLFPPSSTAITFLLLVVFFPVSTYFPSLNKHLDYY